MTKFTPETARQVEAAVDRLMFPGGSVQITKTSRAELLMETSSWLETCHTHLKAYEGFLASEGPDSPSTKAALRGLEGSLDMVKRIAAEAGSCK